MAFTITQEHFEVMKLLVENVQSTASRMKVSMSELKSASDDAEEACSSLVGKCVYLR